MNRACPKCGSGNILRDHFSETGESCWVSGTQAGFIDKPAQNKTTPTACGGGLMKTEDSMPEQLSIDFSVPLMPEEQAVWDCIKGCKGKGSEILGSTIASRTGIDYTTVRAIIAHLINHKHKLIGSNSKGYYVPCAHEEINEVTRSLRHRGIMILVRAAKLQNTSLTEIFNQSCLEWRLNEQ